MDISFYSLLIFLTLQTRTSDVQYQTSSIVEAREYIILLIVLNSYHS